MIRMLIKERRAMSTIEFSLLTVVVILAIIAMQAHFKRGIEGGWRRQIDQVAAQFSSDYENITTVIIESTNQTEAQSNGITEVTMFQDIIRITDEEIEPLDVESQIRI